MQDLVSIITPTYNSADFIADTIECILAQTYQNWELLITDDCSSDNTVEIVLSYAQKDKRIRLFRLETNSGGGVSRNNSIKEANGRYIAFCDSDDRWTKNKLEVQVAFMKEKDTAFSYGSYMLCDEDDKELGINICLSKLTYTRILMDNFVCCLSAMYDTLKIGKIYMPTIRKRQDWGLWISILKKCRVGFGVKQPIGYYRIRKNSVSSNKYSLIRYHAMLYHQMLSMPIFLGYAMYFFVNVPTYLLKSLRTKLINL